QEVELTAVASQATGTVNWWNQEGGSLGNQNPLVFNPVSSQPVYCAVVDQYGCVDTATLFLDEKLDYLFQIPNAFTPNNDQYNDVFLPFFHKNIFEDYQLQVFAAWGQRVFASHNVGEGWDGTINGKPAASAVYLYTFEYTLLNGNAGKLKGEVNLIR
ncbi:MAG: gliding motility-associated C-terminal domain-containing protein, partial [Saprospiraceae bacterium]|nr:gliding motility-associated C-terminal domain-containing protein [Saprospiraceae bacterium]